MARYIEAEALKADIRKRFPPLSLRCEINSIINAQTTADVVEVVRCKDCKHSEHWYGNMSRCFLWHENGIEVFHVGYCSYGERRADETVH